MTARAIHYAASVIWIAALAVAVAGVPIATPDTVGAHAYAIDAEIWFTALVVGHLWATHRTMLGTVILTFVYVGFPALTWYDGTATPAAICSLGFGSLLVIVGGAEWRAGDG